MKKFNLKEKFNNLDFTDKKQVKLLVGIIVLVCVILVGTSYAWLIVTADANKTVGITAGTLDLTFSDTGSNVITLTDSVPISDEDALAGTGYTFTIKNTGNIASTYSIYLEDAALSSGESKLDDKYVKYSITKNSGTPTTALVNTTENGKISKSTLDSDKTDTYTLRVWLDEDAFNSTATNKVFKKSLKIEASQKGNLPLFEDAKVGDYIKMIPTSISYTIKASDTGYDTDQTINPSELNIWRVLSVSDAGIEVISENVSSTNVYFSGMEGYQNYIGTLNKIADQYTNSKYVKSTKHFGYNGQTEYITDTSLLTATPPDLSTETIDNSYEIIGGGDVMYIAETDLVTNALGTLAAKTLAGTETAYWLSSRYYNTDTYSLWDFCPRYISTNGYLSDSYLHNYYDEFYESSFSKAVRPRLTILPTITPSSGKGTSSSPYVLS